MKLVEFFDQGASFKNLAINPDHVVSVELWNVEMNKEDHVAGNFPRVQIELITGKNISFELDSQQHAYRDFGYLLRCLGGRVEFDVRNLDIF